MYVPVGAGQLHGEIRPPRRITIPLDSILPYNRMFEELLIMWQIIKPPMLRLDVGDILTGLS